MEDIFSLAASKPLQPLLYSTMVLYDISSIWLLIVQVYK